MERDREERGDEVVITISEVKECSRCGETRVVSENKEVTSVDQLLEESGSAAAPPVSATADATGTGTADTSHDSSEGDAAGAAETATTADTADADAGDAEGETVRDATDAAAAAADDGGDPDAAAVDTDFDHPAADPAEDGGNPDVQEDAEILGADDDTSAGGGVASGAGDAEPTANAADSGGRAHGEWPDADANRRGDDADGGPAEWPDADRNLSDQPTDEAGADDQHRPADGESEDVEFIDSEDDGAEDEGSEDAAANEARTDVVPDAKRADEPGAATDPSEEDVEFVDGAGPDDWPEQAGDDEGYDAELGDDDGGDGVSVDGNLTPQVDPEVASQEDVEFIEADADAAAGGPAPTAEDDRSDGASGGDPADAGCGTPGPDDAERSRPNVELRTTVDRVDTVYVCPECGNGEPVGASSMRAGDICPECKRGYIEEREVQ